MAESGENRDRQVVPRWRTFSSAATFGELCPVSVRPQQDYRAEFESKWLEDWERAPGLSVASDILCAAVTLGVKDGAEVQARYILDSDSSRPTIRDIAERYISGSLHVTNRLTADSFGPPDLNQINTAIHAARIRLVLYPQNPILWTNLALFYTIVGQPNKAQRAMLTALGLAPHNRFTTRAASRLFLHLGDSERAHDILVRNPGVKYDPWLLSAEIVVSSVRRRSSHLVRTAKSLVGSKTQSPFNLSELNGALATLEAQNANIKKAKNFCKSALIDPAENAVAQADWLSRNVDERAFEPLLPKVAVSSEANVWISRAKGNWEESLRHALTWQSEQPFSSRPAMAGSHIASTALEDFSTAEAILDQGIRSNPNDASLRNNRAFALAKQNQVDEAKKELQLARELHPRRETQICLLATEGLIAFRSGQTELGRLLYLQSMADAEREDNLMMRDIATIYWAIEEARIHSIDSQLALKRAQLAVERLESPYREMFRRKLGTLAQHIQSQ